MSIYSYEEVLAASKKYFEGEELPAKIFADKYSLRNNQEELLELTPDDMHRRLAKEFARVEAKKFAKPFTEEEIYGWFYKYETLIPQGSPIYGIGNPYQYVTLSNCYVLTTPEDNYNSILDTDKQLVNISKRRGGVGIDLSLLRPAGSLTNNAARTSTGVPSWMERYSNSIREVGQCLHEDSLVLSFSGIKKIKDIVPGESVWTKKGWVEVNNVYNNGKKNVYKITTSAGYSVISSKDHIYQTFNENGDLTETTLENLNIGDDVILCLGEADRKASGYISLEISDYKNTNNKPDNCILPILLDENLAYLLGYGYGDGYVIHDEYGDNGLEFACSNNYPTIKSKLQRICLDSFEYDIKYSDGDGALENLSIYNKTIVQFLAHNNLLKQKSSSIEFPELILKSNIRVQLAFLSGYFDADGDAVSVKTGYRFRSINREFLEKVQILLSSFGIASKITEQDRSEQGWQSLHSLAIVGTISQQKFVYLFGHSIKVQDTGFISKRDCWLSPFKAKSFGIKHNKYSYCPDNTQYLSLATLYRLKEENKIINNLLQDTIKNIEYIGEANTYDLGLEEEHLFWCNGMYVHNSGRRGALMTTLDVHHPDIEKFITIKNDRTKVTGANISVRLSNEFLNAVNNNENYELRFPVKSLSPKFSKKISAKYIWDMIIHNAWAMAEPGLLFWDNVIQDSIPDCYTEFGFATVSTNPCSELPLSELDSCRLLVINLICCVVNPFTKDAHFDYKKLYELSQIGQRLMDDLIDLELEAIDRILEKIKNDPEKESIKKDEIELWQKIKHQCEIGRRTGLGITVLGDTLAALGIKYGSEESITVTDKIYKTLKFGSYRSSVDMAKELGAFPIWNWQLEKDNPFLNRIKDECLDFTIPNDDPQVCNQLKPIFGKELFADIEKYGRRNIANLTTAPTGTISTQAGFQIGDNWYHNTTSGIEPCFKTSYTRRKKGNPGDTNFRTDFVDQNGDHWMEFPVYHSGVSAWMSVNNKTTEDETSPYFQATSNHINWQQRVKLQAAAQRHIDHSISSTVNVPEDITEEEVAKIYETAWKSGCKGVTIYRENCRSGVLIDNSKAKKETPSGERPKELNCEVYHITSKGQSYFVLVGMLNDKPYEVFAGKNGFLDKSIKSGKIIRIKKRLYKAVFDDETELTPITACSNEQEETITRLTSALLRSGASMHLIVQQLERVGGDMHSFAKALARVLKKHIPDGTKEHGESCPECKQEALVRAEGCVRCQSCGWTKCS